MLWTSFLSTARSAGGCLSRFPQTPHPLYLRTLRQHPGAQSRSADNLGLCRGLFVPSLSKPVRSGSESPSDHNSAR